MRVIHPLPPTLYGILQVKWAETSSFPTCWDCQEPPAPGPHGSQQALCHCGTVSCFTCTHRGAPGIRWTPIPSAGFIRLINTVDTLG